MDIKVQFGQRLRELRKKKGLSQEKFSFECNLDRTYIAGIETGKRNVSLENIEKIAKGFNISLSELFKDL
ncbi:MAG TPA: XRE family transcriptional regulator [Bacteroidales bacterium]|nr:XRE family transcriptional regulator [Bacteroidales bacterium]